VRVNLGQGELGKTIRKNSNANNLPVCKGTLAICLALGINCDSVILIF